MMNKHLIILGCSSTKIDSHGLLPAIHRYDGPYYRVLSSFLKQYIWPTNLSIGILSARYGLIGGLTPIEFYNQRMDRLRAIELQPSATKTLFGWSQFHQKISLILGKDYLAALDTGVLNDMNSKAQVIPGPIGMQLHFLHTQLRDISMQIKPTGPTKPDNRPLYFLPDWDDMLDSNYDFQRDKFSHQDRSERIEQHCIQAMQPKRICDGVVVSLAQHQGTKGIIRRSMPTDIKSLAPDSIRDRYGLTSNQWAFGDCGAFTYVNEETPTISTEQALSLYQLYDFDMGASVDHIPTSKIITPNGKRELSSIERRNRVKTTKENAAEFITLHKNKRCTFIPVGVIQGVSTRSYAKQLPEYVEMGYTRLAVGGLVPRTDKEIVSIVKSIDRKRKTLPPGIRDNLWIHLFGVFRPKIQNILRTHGVASFDSASYFRKAWLRADQNYFGPDGEWYTAIRVPVTADGRTRKRLVSSGIPLPELEILELETLQALHEYGQQRRSIDSTLEAIAQYDFLLDRGEGHGVNLLPSYRRTLESRIWEKCDCPICKQIGIDVIIFRGYNRNKRRGAHNTLALYNKLGE